MHSGSRQSGRRFIGILLQLSLSQERDPGHLPEQRSSCFAKVTIAQEQQTSHAAC